MRVRERSAIRIAVATALVLIGSSVLVSACAASGSDQGSAVPESETAADTQDSEMPTNVAEFDLTGLDVEMHYAVG